MKKDISNDQAYVFAIEILSDYDKLKSQPQPGIAHQKTNYFFDSIRTSYLKHRGALGKMTLSEYNKFIIPFCHSLQPPSKKKKAEIAESDETKSAEHFYEVNCSGQLPKDEEQEFLEDIMSDEGANLVMKYLRVA